MSQIIADVPKITIDRLTIRRQFLYVAQGHKATGRFVLLQTRPSSDHAAVNKPIVRYGLTASKKVGNAVARNRARRRLRAAMLELLPIHAKLGNDYVAVARTATVTADWPALLDDLTRLFKRLSPPLVSNTSHKGAAAAAS
jgi:ribonuclease P protein component